MASFVLLVLLLVLMVGALLFMTVIGKMAVTPISTLTGPPPRSSEHREGRPSAELLDNPAVSHEL